MKKITRWWGWRNIIIFSNPLHSVRIKGGRSATRAHWWNLWWCVWRGWNNVAIFEVSFNIAATGFYICFEPEVDPRTGQSMFYRQRLHYRRFGMLVGDGNCLFWIDDKIPGGQSLPLKLVGFCHRKDKAEIDLPLL